MFLQAALQGKQAMHRRSFPLQRFSHLGTIEFDADFVFKARQRMMANIIFVTLM